MIAASADGQKSALHKTTYLFGLVAVEDGLSIEQLEEDGDRLVEEEAVHGRSGLAPRVEVVADLGRDCAFRLCIWRVSVGRRTGGSWYQCVDRRASPGRRRGRRPFRLRGAAPKRKPTDKAGEVHREGDSREEDMSGRPRLGGCRRCRRDGRGSRGDGRVLGGGPGDRGHGESGAEEWIRERRELKRVEKEKDRGDGDGRVEASLGGFWGETRNKRKDGDAPIREGAAGATPPSGNCRLGTAPRFLRAFRKPPSATLSHTPRDLSCLTVLYSVTYPQPSLASPTKHPATV